MTGEVISDLLTPLIGKSGTIFMVVNRSGQMAGLIAPASSSLSHASSSPRTGRRTRSRGGRPWPMVC